MFLLDGQPLSPDRAFATSDGTQYPANWLRLASLEEKEAIGISEVADPIPVDQRFYWDTGIPKDHAQLVEQWIAQTKTTAGSLLAPTDWLIVRMAETGTGVAQEVLDRRAEIRVFSNIKEQAILETTDTDELAAYVLSPEYSRWEAEEVQEGIVTE